LTGGLSVEALRFGYRGQLVGGPVSFAVAPGEVLCLLGPNGGGKTTLLNTILGMPGYEISQGTIAFRGQDLAALSIDERARLGIGVAFQRPPAVRGIKLRQMMRVAAGADFDDAELSAIAEEVDVAEMLDRDVNLGFSGGEAKRAEMAQLLAQQPALAMFDEPESGVDLDNIAVVGAAMHRLLRGERANAARRAGLIITHTGHILQYVTADVGHVLYEGRLACRGNPLDLIADISSQGYERCVECAACNR